MSRKQKKFHFIYKTTDNRNGNFYIGMHSTEDLNDGYIGSGTRLKHLIYKHGKEIFNMEILEFLPDRKSLKERESEIVNSDLLLEEKCMNLKPGGYGGFVNEEHRKKFLDSAKKTMIISLQNGHKTQSLLWKTNKNWIDTQRKKRSLSSKGNKSFTGKTHKEESKRKIGVSNSVKQKGMKNSQFGTFWITNGEENKKNKNTTLIPYGWYKGRTIQKKK